MNISGKMHQIFMGTTFRIVTIIMALVLQAYHASAQVVTYPAPPGLVTSPDFSVKANEKPIWVEKIGSNVHTAKYAFSAAFPMITL